MDVKVSPAREKRLAKLREAMNVAREALWDKPVNYDGKEMVFRAMYFEHAMKAVLKVKGLPSRDRKPDRVSHLVGSVLWWLTDGHHSLSFEELHPYSVSGHFLNVVFMAGYNSANPAP